VILPHERYLCQQCNSVRDSEIALGEAREIGRRDDRKCDVLAPVSEPASL